MVLLNSLLLGFEADFIAQHGEPLPYICELGESLFCIIFVMELALRIWVQGKWCQDDVAWKMFDSLMVMFQVLGQLEQVSKMLRIPTNFSFIRMLRLIRLVHLFEELRTLTSAVATSGASLLW